MDALRKEQKFMVTLELMELSVGTETQPSRSINEDWIIMSVGVFLLVSLVGHKFGPELQACLVR